MNLQGKFRSINSKNRKSEIDLGRNIFQNQSVFDGLVIRKKVLLKSSHRIETHINVVVEVLEVQISAAFEFYIDEEFI